MKRIISLLVVMVMCVGLFIPSAVMAEQVTETTTETVYYFRLPLNYFNPLGETNNTQKAAAAFTFEVPGASSGTISVYQIEWDGTDFNKENAPALTDKIGDITVTAQTGDYQTLSTDSITSSGKSFLERATEIFTAYKNAYDTAADDAKLAKYKDKPYISIALSTKDDIKIRGTQKGDAIAGEYSKTLDFEDVVESEVTNDIKFYTSDTLWSGALKGATVADAAKNSRYSEKVIHSSSTRNEGGVKISKNGGISGNYMLVQSDYSNSITATFYNMFPAYDSSVGERIYQISFDTKIFDDDIEREEYLSAKDVLKIGVGGEFNGKEFTYKYNINGNSTTDPLYILNEVNSAYFKDYSKFNKFAGYDGMDMSSWNTYLLSNVTTELNNYGALVMILPRMEESSTHGLGFDNIKVQEITHQPKIKLNNPSKYNKTGPSAICQNRDQYYAPVAAKVLDFTTVNTGNNVYLYKLPLDYVNAVDADENERKLSVKFDFKTTAASNGIVAAYKTDWNGGAAPANLESQITKENRLGAVAVNPTSDNKYGSYSIDITEYARAAVQSYNTGFTVANAKERPYVSIVITTTDNVELISSAKAAENAWTKVLDFNNQPAAANNVANLKDYVSYTWSKQSPSLNKGDSIINADYDVFVSQSNPKKKGAYLVGDGKENSLVVGTFSGDANKVYFYNMFGDKSTGAKAVTEDDIGRIFDVSFDAKISSNSDNDNRTPINFGIAGSDRKYVYRTTNNDSQCQPFYNVSGSGVSASMQKFNGIDLANGDTIKTSWEIQNTAEQGFLRIDLTKANDGGYTIGYESVQLDNITVKEITDAPKVEFRNPAEYSDGFEARRQYHAVAAEAKVMISEINDDMDDMLVCTAVADNNGSTQPSDVRAMIAFYNGDELVTVKFSALVTVGAGERKNVSIIVPKTSVSGYTTAKGFVWDMNTLKPYADEQDFR